MSTIVVLAMHGAPPNDIPRRRMGEFFGLHMQLEHGAVPEEKRSVLESRYGALEEMIASWPRTAQNDPFHAASFELAEELATATGQEVVVGFNEFCNPNLDAALAQAAVRETEKVIVVTPMMTPGGEHAEIDIPAAVDRARARHPEVDFQYAWPFDTAEVAQFLSAHIAQST